IRELVTLEDFERLIAAGRTAVSERKWAAARRALDEARAKLPEDFRQGDLPSLLERANSGVQFDASVTSAREAFRDRRYSEAATAYAAAQRVFPDEFSRLDLQSALDDATRLKGVAADFERFLMQGVEALAARRYADAIAAFT